MPIPKSSSKLSLSRINPGVSSALEYLTMKFPSITSAAWRQRMLDGKAHWHGGRLITPERVYQPQQRVYYYREVASEPITPFEEHILFQDEQRLAAFKPNFLPVTPGGVYINECLQNRLREKQVYLTDKHCINSIEQRLDWFCFPFKPAIDTYTTHYLTHKTYTKHIKLLRTLIPSTKVTYAIVRHAHIKRPLLPAVTSSTRS